MPAVLRSLGEAAADNRTGLYIASAGRGAIATVLTSSASSPTAEEEKLANALPASRRKRRTGTGEPYPRTGSAGPAKVAVAAENGEALSVIGIRNAEHPSE